MIIYQFAPKSQKRVAVSLLQLLNWQTKKQKLKIREKKKEMSFRHTNKLASFFMLSSDSSLLGKSSNTTTTIQSIFTRERIK